MRVTASEGRRKQRGTVVRSWRLVRRGAGAKRGVTAVEKGRRLWVAEGVVSEGEAVLAGKEISFSYLSALRARARERGGEAFSEGQTWPSK